MSENLENGYRDLVEILHRKGDKTYHVLHTEEGKKFKLLRRGRPIESDNIFVQPFTKDATEMTISMDEIKKTLEGNGNYTSYSNIIIPYLKGRQMLSEISEETQDLQGKQIKRNS